MLYIPSSVVHSTTRANQDGAGELPQLTRPWRYPGRFTASLLIHRANNTKGITRWDQADLRYWSYQKWWYKSVISSALPHSRLRLKAALYSTTTIYPTSPVENFENPFKVRNA